MFISLDDTTQRFLLSELVLLWAGLLFGGFIFNRYRPEEQRRMPTWTRIGSSIVLVVAAGSWAIATSRGFLIGPVTLLIALGMLCGFVGDLALAGLLQEWLQVGKEPGRSVQIGMVAFALGHIAYIAALVALAALLSLTSGTAFAISLAIWLGIGVMGWLVVVARGTASRTLRLLALPYALLLGGLAGCATALAAQSPYFLPVAIGGGLFVVSDFFVAGEQLSGWRFPLLGDLIWLTYGPAQILIIYSAECALRYLAQ